MRLAALALGIVLAFPTLAAAPLVDEWPHAFTYEVFGAAPRAIATDAAVAVHGSLTGVAWSNNDLLRGGEFSVQVRLSDGVRTHSHTLPSTFPAVAFDGSGVFHVARRGGTEGARQLEVTSFENEEWITRTIWSAPAMTFPVTMARDGVPYIFVIYDQVGHLFRFNSESREWIEAPTLPHPTSSARGVIDSQGRVHLVYLASQTSNPWHHARYSVLENGAWTTQPAPFTWQDTADNFDIAIGADDRPWFAYGDITRRPHVMIPNPSGGWDDVLIANARIGSWVELEVDPLGRPHLISVVSGDQNVPTNNNYYYHTRSEAGVWSSQIVLPGTWQFFGDLALDDDGYPVIALPTTRMQTVVLTEASKAWGGVVIARPAARLASGAGNALPGMP